MRVGLGVGVGIGVGVGVGVAKGVGVGVGVGYRSVTLPLISVPSRVDATAAPEIGYPK